MPRIALLTLVALLTLTSPASAKREVPRGWLGVVADGPLPSPTFASADEWDRLAGSGPESVRAALYWRAVQPTGAADADFSATDPVVLAASRRGLALLPVLQGTPDWAAQNPGDPGSPPANPATFGTFLSMLVTRYGPGGSFWQEHPELPARPIRAWQIWNEPNITRYWNVVPWAPPYVKLVKVARTTLRQADQHAKIVLAGLPNASWEALDAIYKAGARGSFDVVALHPYTGNPTHVVKIVRFIRRRMIRHKDGKLP